MPAKKSVTPEVPIRILKKATCQSLRKSKITYHIGIDPESQICFRVISSSGGGYVNKDWIPWPDIEKALSKVKSGIPITSAHIAHLFKGSSNNRSFTISVLRAENVILPFKGRQNSNEVADPKPFLDMVKKLIASDRKAPNKRTPATRKRPSGPRKTAKG